MFKGKERGYKSFKKNQFNIIEVIILIVVSIVFGMVIGISLVYQRKISSSFSLEASEIVSTYENILDSYYERVDKKVLMNSAIQGMIESLDDPYSSYFNSIQSESFHQTVDGSYVGIGATVLYQDGKFIIEDILNNSPASDVGVKKGDILFQVGEEKVEGKSLDEVSHLIQGKSGSKVKITVIRGKEKKSFVVERNVVEIVSVHEKVISEGKEKIGYFLIDDFALNTYDQFKSKYRKLLKKNVTSYIIDVRDNPGGHLVQVEKILNLFFDHKTVLYQIESKGKKKKIYSSGSENIDLPVVILINSSSASAAEILASCFHENDKKAILVGSTTYGKGTVQKTVSLSSGASLKYTTQKWLTSKGVWIDQKGIRPDYEVLQNDEEENGEDFVLQKAIDLLTKRESD